MDDTTTEQPNPSNVTPLSSVRPPAAPESQPNPFLDRIKAMGEPMHPFQFAAEGIDPITCMGATMRDYFAANAPEVPDWFKYTPGPQTPRPAMPVLQEQPEEVIKAVADRNKKSPAYEIWAKLLSAHEEAVAAWHVEINAQRFFAWLWRYATLMMAYREG